MEDNDEDKTPVKRKRKRACGAFRFKQFSVEHRRSSMRVGVDAVLLGAWAEVPDGCLAPRILDVGCGCGVITLMMAQRFPEAAIEAIDIDAASAEEAADNFRSSPWSERLCARQRDFASMPGEAAFDLIVSNPPYFHAGIESPSTTRERARHAAALSPESLIDGAGNLLSRKGALAMVIPAENAPDIIAYAARAGLFLQRSLMSAGRPDRPVKRALLQFCRPLRLDIESQPGIYSDDYRHLTEDFYIIF